jgi:Protein kinase domain
MRTPETHLEPLSDDQRQVLEAWVVKFDLSWDERALVAWAQRLHPRGDPLRWPILVEMVKIDLERRWQRGQRARLEAYLKALPELGAAGRLPADLILAEYEARRQCGAPAELAEFARRFPRQAYELRRLAARAPVDAAGDGGAASLETHRSSDQGDDFVTPTVSPTTPGAAPLAGRLGRYRIVRELGRGAMGTVYLAHDSQLDRRVALKVPLFTADDGLVMRQRFLSEARAAATIEHPNICPVYDVGEIDGTPYLTMTYLQGEPLSRMLEDQAPLPPRRAVALVRRLAVALEAAHARGIIHRDLKPSNVMITPGGDPVILDFGLARRMREDARLTQLGQPLGTPAYMSPEQVVGAIDLMGPGCDIYALGVILYQLLTGRLPFEGSVVEVLARSVAHEPDPPSKLRADVDRRLDAICLKALSKRVADRYGSMGEFGAALFEYLRHDSPPVAIPVVRTGMGPTTGTWWPRRARPWQLGGGVAAGALALLAWALSGSGSPGTIRIELDDARAEVEVLLDGEPVTMAPAPKAFRLAAGKHHLAVTGRKVQPISTTFTVARGENPALRIHLVPLVEPVADPAPPPVAPRRRQHEKRDDRDEREDD